MDLETKVLFEFGRFRLDPAEHSLHCDGQPLSLAPKAFDLLLALVEKKGRLVGKEELMTKLWPDSFVEEANLTVNISTLRKALGERSAGEEYIETVPKRGYRFVAPVIELRNGETRLRVPLSTQEPSPDKVEPVRSPADSRQAGIESPPSEKKRTSNRARLAVGLAALSCALALAGYSIYVRPPASQEAAPARRSLAILPFQNLRKDADSDFLGFSLADAVITKLDYVSALTVRPSYAIERYRNQGIEMRKVAAELNVDTLLTGAYLRDGEDLRITSQLVDVKTERILWKGTFDVKYDRLLTVQDQVAQQIIKGLELNLPPSEVERLKPEKPIEPLAYEYYLRGVDLYARNDFPMAIKLLEKSAEIDPKYALTWAQLGTAYTADASFQFGGREYYDRAQTAYEKALSLQPSQIEARVYMANLFTDTGRVEQAVPLLREAIKTNPNHAEVHWELGYAYRFAGMLGESVSECERARQLDPGVKRNSSALNGYLYLGEYDKFLQSLPQDNDVAFNLFYRGLGEYYRQDRELAAKDWDRAFELDPSFFQARVGKAFSDSIHDQKAKGMAILRETEDKIRRRGTGDPEAIYKVAQAYAALGDKTASLRMLRQSIEKGFFCHPYFTSDPLLDSLRNDPELGRLLEMAKGRHESFKKAFF